jgi:hypothetical protein
MMPNVGPSRALRVLPRGAPPLLPFLLHRRYAGFADAPIAAGAARETRPTIAGRSSSGEDGA